jgi:2-oxo-3-(phosphooxy)propyl 3-oxoalkanoate synthase
MDTLTAAPWTAPDAAALPQPAAADGLDFQRTVPRELVHKSAVSEVFLTDSLETGADRFLLAAQWPRDHAVFRPGPDGHTDSMVIIETMRQAGMLVFHRYYSVPLSVPFIVRSLDFEIIDPAALVGTGAPQEATLDLRVTFASTRMGRRRAFEMESMVRVGSGPVCARVTFTGDLLDKALYQRLRARPDNLAPLPPAVGLGRQLAPAPVAVGRTRAKDVMLTAPDDVRPGRWELRMDPTHPTFFDHGSDHVQAIVLLEAMRQSGFLAAPAPTRLSGPGAGVLTRLRAEFHAYGEFAPAIVLDAAAEPEDGRPSDERAVQVLASQAGRPIASARMEFRRPNQLRAGVGPVSARARM